MSALPVAQEAPKEADAKSGANDPSLATSLNNLAELYCEEGKYAEAEPLYQRALEIQEKALGRNHPDLATSLDNLAGLYLAEGKYAEPEPLYQRALEIQEKALGPNHADVGTASIRVTLRDIRMKRSHVCTESRPILHGAPFSTSRRDDFQG